jgi:putative transposase
LSLPTTPSNCDRQRTSLCDPIQVSQWKRQLLEAASELFSRGKKSMHKGQDQAKEAELFQQIGHLQMEVAWLKKSLSCSDAHELRKLVAHDHPELSVSYQWALLGLPRSTLSSYKTRAAAASGWWTTWPERGSRSAVIGIQTSQHRSRRSIRALFLPGGVNTVTAVDQVWATDITYIPLPKGFLYLMAIVDLLSRKVYSFGEGFAYSWKHSNSLATEFYLDALEMALGGDRLPEVFYSDP